MKEKNIIYIQQTQLLIIILLIITICSCKKEKFITDSTAKLQFSADTLLFDTVFTTVGSITKQFKVYNPHNSKIAISNIRLAGNTNSLFSINIDGIAATNLSNVEMEAKDSIFIFVKVTVDPNNSNSPLVISDSILFETNGNLQKIQLVAWGQDAYYHTPKYPTNNPWYSVIPCNAIWTSDKPHVIYGYAVVDSACTLTIKENTKVYMHNNAVLWIYRDGTLNINGTLGNPVIFQGDRLEQYYQDVPGQWSRIWISRGSKNKIDHAIIKNGIVGIHVDTLGDNCNEPALKISNTIIKNMSAAGMFFQGTWVEAENCVIGNCGQYGVVLNIGGKYDFKHSTIVNYWNNANRQTPSLVLNNWYEDINGDTQLRDLTKANFANCIIYGTVEEELLLDKKSGALFNYNFDHCLIKTKLDTSASFTANCINCLFNSNPSFIDASLNNYSLSDASAAINKGSFSIANFVPFDILRHNRTTNTAPDIGAFEKK